MYKAQWRELLEKKSGARSSIIITFPRDQSKNMNAAWTWVRNLPTFQNDYVTMPPIGKPILLRAPVSMSPKWIH